MNKFNRLLVVGVAACIVLSALSQCLADQSAKPIPKVAVSPAPASSAQSADLVHHTLGMVEKTIKASSDCSIDSTFTLFDGQTKQTYRITGFAERPNKVDLNGVQDGKPVGTMICDGTTLYAYSPTSGHFVKAKVAAGELKSSDPTFGAFLQNEFGNALTQAFLAGVSNFLYADMDVSKSLPNFPGATQKITLSQSSTTYNGLPVIATLQHVAFTSKTGDARSFDMMVKTLVDKASNKPVLMSLSVGPSADKLTELQREEYASFNLLAQPASGASFTITPPTTATAYVPPATPSEPAASKLLAAGTAAPDFTVQTADGKPVKLSDYAGKVVVVDCWATWCGPCQISLPHTEQVFKKYQAKSVVFLPVCVWDTKANFTAWLPQHKSLTMTFLFDPAGESDTNVWVAQYGVNGIPSQFVIGKDGKIVSSFVGYDESTDPNELTLQAAIDKALAAS